MRKEVIFAIVIGAVFGMAIVLGIKRINNTNLNFTGDQSENKTVNQLNETSDNSSDPITIAVISPQNYDALTNNNTTISGLTIANSWVILLSSDEDQILQASNTGEFNFDVELSGGINRFRLIALNQDGRRASEDMTIVYTSQLQE